MALWISALLLGAIALIRAGALTAPPYARWLAALPAASFPPSSGVIRPALYALNLLGLGVLLAVVAAGAGVHDARSHAGFRMLRGGIGLALSVGFGPLPPGQRHPLGRAADGWPSPPPLAVGAGFAAAVPVLVVFSIAARRRRSALCADHVPACSSRPYRPARHLSRCGRHCLAQRGTPPGWLLAGGARRAARCPRGRSSRRPPPSRSSPRSEPCWRYLSDFRRGNSS